jgi:hypothetical protein
MMTEIQISWLVIMAFIGGLFLGIGIGKKA